MAQSWCTVAGDEYVLRRRWRPASKRVLNQASRPPRCLRDLFATRCLVRDEILATGDGLIFMDIGEDRLSLIFDRYFQVSAIELL